jgi:hypothetical protein
MQAIGADRTATLARITSGKLPATRPKIRIKPVIDKPKMPTTEPNAVDNR